MFVRSSAHLCKKIHIPTSLNETIKDFTSSGVDQISFLRSKLKIG
jgi:hypothetical protein